MASLPALPKAYPIVFHNPQLGEGTSPFENRGEPAHVRDHVRLVLGLQPKHDDPGVLVRRVGANIGEIHIECKQNSGFSVSPGCNNLVRGAGKGFVPYGLRVKPVFTQRCRSLDRQILVCLEPHALSSNGSSTVPSRANSAAYASAASMSCGFKAG